MNAVIEEPNKNVTELRAPGPGERLRAARVSAGSEISKVAAQLHLNDAMVHALERDDYHAMPSRVFIRGYLRNYARLVGVPAESILKQFDEQFPDELQDRQLNRIGASVRHEVRSNHSAVRLVTWLMLFAVLGAFFASWTGYLSWFGPSSVASIEEDSEPTPSALLSGDDGQLALPSRPQPVAPSIGPATGDRLDTQLAVELTPGVSAPSAVKPSPLTANSRLPLPPARMVDESQLPAKTSSLALQMATSGGTLATEPPLEPLFAGQGIILQFDGPCWVDVRDSKRKFKLFGEMPKGTRKRLGGTPPYDVVLGNASVVKVSINGAYYDVMRYARGNVARFRLDPASS